MKHLTFITLFFAFIAVAPAVAGNDIVVMSFKGKVEVQISGKGKFAAVTVGQALTTKDVVRTSFASYVKLMYKGSRLLSIDENRTVKMSEIVSTIDGASSNGSTTGKIMSYLADKLSKKPTKDEKQSLYGAVRGLDEAFNATFPRKGYVLTPQPTFEWVAGDANAKYTFLLLDENLNTLLEQPSDQTSLAYSQSMPPLAAGKKYLWRVVRQSDALESDVVSFSVMHPDTTSLVQKELALLVVELKKMKADEIIVHVIKGTYLEQRELYQDAFREYREAVRLAPDVKEYREMAMYLLFKIGLYNEQQLLLQ